MKKRESPTTVRFSSDTKVLLKKAVKATKLKRNNLVNKYVIEGCKRDLK